LPLPVAPLVIVIHEALLVAAQEQPVPAVTFTVPVAAADEVRLEPVDEIANVHGAPGWVTVKLWPPTVMVPVREVDAVLAATL
jgi:hypothetical protein